MKILKKIGIVILAIVLLVVIVSFFLPRKVNVERSLEIKVAPATVFNLVNNLKAWEEWSPWHRMDPGMKIEYSENPVGVNASYAWESDHRNVGNGKLTILESTSPEHIKTQLDFEGMSSAYSHYYFKPTETGVMVTWSMESDMGLNPISKFFGLMMDKMLGPDFEKGLANMKEVAEKTPVKETIAGYDFELRDIPAMMVLGIREKIKIADLGGAKFAEWYGAISQSMAKQKGQYAGAPMAVYYSYDQNETELEAAVPVTGELKSDGKIKYHEMPGTKALVVKHFGGYTNLSPVYDEAFAYLKTHDMKSTGAPMEIYVTDPSMEKDTAKWLTEIAFPYQ